MDDEGYRHHNETKQKWYAKHFPERLVVIYESKDLSKAANKIIEQYFGS